MAKVNMVIRAFDSEELQMLCQWAEGEEKRLEAEGYIPTDSFQELKATIQLASKYTLIPPPVRGE